MSKPKLTSNPEIDFDAPLSPEADQFLREAIQEFNRKQAALQKDWRFDSYQEWRYDQLSGVLRLMFKDGAEFNADGQALGSYSPGDHSWEWAWNNPHVEAAMARDSQLVKQAGERLGISYLVAGMIPVSADVVPTFLCAIGAKATDSVGVFRGQAGPIEVMLTLKNPRWKKPAR